MCPQALLKSAPHGQNSARIWEASTYMHQYDQYHILCIAIIICTFISLLVRWCK